MILYYNNSLVSLNIKNSSSQIAPFLSKDYTKELFDKYEKFELNKRNMVYDRSGAIPHFLDMNPLHPMPARQEGYNRSFFEVAEQRAKELLATNKKINVLWSGGIDSTFILFMLNHYANDPDQVCVYGTYNSIIESGDLFDRRIKNEFQYKIKLPTINEFNYEDPDAIYVSGMCGNQLFGPTDDMFAATTPNALFHHTLGTPETIYEPYETNINPELLEFLAPAIAASPRTIETVADLRWYCIFNLDWYSALYEHRIQVFPERAERVHGFFDSEEFQSWAVNTKEPFTKVPGDANTHRWQMRQVIAEMFDEEHYAYNKPKKISTFSKLDPTWFLLLDGYQNVYTKTGLEKRGLINPD